MGALHHSRYLPLCELRSTFFSISPELSHSLSHKHIVFLQAEAEIQVDAVAPGQKVLLIDDLLATGGKNHCLTRHLSL